MKKLMSLLLVLVLLASCLTVLAETESEEFVCREENFSVRIPAGASARYEEGTGLVIYTRSEGKIPYVVISRRSQEMKFKNPENYLNNVFREYMEDKCGDSYMGMNMARTWEAGGKELLGARYMYKVGDVPVTLLLLLEIRDGGDVEYAVKFTENTEEITMAALDTAVQSYRETDIEAPAVPEATEAPQAPDVSEGSGTAPAFLVPSQFADRFNATMNALADQYADSLGEEGVQILREYFTFVYQDFQGSAFYYDTEDGHVEAGFLFPDGTAPNDSTPAQSLNLAIRNDTPDVAAYFAKWILEMMIVYEYQDEVSAEELENWFASAGDPGDIFSIPGYTLNVLPMEDYTHYAVLPAGGEPPAGTTAEPTEELPQGSAEKPVVWDDSEWADFHCEEDGFTTKKPYHALTQYKNDRGYVGITFYLDVPGYPPYVMIHRRPMEGKFKNPEGYLNNTYREFLEDKFASASVSTNMAKIWEVGGKQLIGAKYTIKDEYGETIQLQLIEVRELGDVEYTVMYNGADEEELVMKALDAAVANYVEDEAKDTSAATTETASAEVLSGSLPGLAEIREKIESGSKFSGVIRRNSNGAVIFSLEKQYFEEDIRNLWDAANNITIGEPVEVPAEAPRTYIEFWLASQDFVRLNFAGDYYEAPDGTCYRLENDGRFRELVNAMTDQELAMIRLDYRPVILGKTTPAELVNFGWDLSFEEDGTIVLSQDGRDGMIFVTTEHASMNRPIMKVNAMWAEDLDIEYFGFDGYVSPYLAEGEDNDQRWNKEYSYEVLINAWERDDIQIDRWGALCNWLVDELGAKLSEEGIYEAEVTLSDGRTVYISSHDTAPCISLIGD